jgi:hypothetical protein
MALRAKHMTVVLYVRSAVPDGVHLASPLADVEKVL